MNNEEHDDLWHLLGRAKRPAESPFFARNVLRAVRGEMQDSLRGFAWFRRYWQFTAVSACLLIIAGVVFSPSAEQPDAAIMLLAEQVSQSPDYQVISHLDELLASVESSVWLEN